METAPTGRFFLRETGASLVEYTLLLALIAVVSIGAITLVGEKAEETLDCVAIELDEPEIRRRILIKQTANDQALNIIEARFSVDCL